MNAITFTMLQDGVPIIYQGQEQHLAGGATPSNREALWLSGYNTTTPLYKHIKLINTFRNLVTSANSAFVASNLQPVYWDARTLVTRKGPSSTPVIGIYTNIGQNGAAYALSLAKTVTMFNKNQQVIDVISCELFTTDKTGNLAVIISDGLPRVLWDYKSIAGRGICGSK
jgi:alpha-amylase